jgi:hypothetical protein
LKRLNEIYFVVMGESQMTYPNNRSQALPPSSHLQAEYSEILYFEILGSYLFKQKGTPTQFRNIPYFRGTAF